MNWQTVFDNYPSVNEIFVVDGMPFLKAEHAQAHSITTGQAVQSVQREKPEAQHSDEPEAPKNPKAPKQPKAPK